MNNKICIYCKKPVLSNEAYSMRKMGSNYIWWHYLCYTKNKRELIELTTESKNELIKYLLKNFTDPQGWSLEVLRGLGYGKE